MASKIPKSALKAATRGYSAQTAAKSATSHGAGLQVARLPSGTTVASLENNSPISRVGVFVRAGSRYATSPGISHILRLSASNGLSTNQRTGFNMTRVVQQYGGLLNVCADRELAVYSIAGCRDYIDQTLSVLSSLSGNNSYRQYEFVAERDIVRLRTSLKEVSSEERVLDLLAKAAYRSQSLANTVYLPDYRVGKINADELNAFITSTHGPGGIVVVGTGVDQEVLAAGAAAVGVSGGGFVQPGTSTLYLGGDLRLEIGGATTTVAVAGEGAKLSSAESVSAEVAAQLLAGGPSSVLARALKGAVASVQGISLAYSDSGLLGFTIQASAAEAPKLVASLTAVAKNLTASDKDVTGAKARAKVALLDGATACGEVSSIGRQLLLTGNYVSAEDAARAVDAVTPAAVTKVIAKAFSGKLSVAAVGNVNNVPYSDTL